MTAEARAARVRAAMGFSPLDAEITSITPYHTDQVVDSLMAFAQPFATMAQSHKAFLLNLPVEMLQMVCTHIFDPNEDLPARDSYSPPNGYVVTVKPIHSDKAAARESLANFGATCRVVREITLPILYRNITAYQGFLQGEMMCDFTRSLLDNPSLGPLVRSIDLSNVLPWPKPHEHPDQITDDQTSIIATLARRVRSIGPEAALEILNRKERWMRLAPPSAWWAAHAVTPCLLLCMTPGITSVKMLAQDIWDSNFLAARQPDSRKLQPRLVFNKLTTLHLHTKNIELSTILGLLAASPNLKTLTLMGASGWEADLPLVKLSKLTTLTLGECRLCPQGIKYMIECCTDLVNFSYVQVDNRESHPSNFYAFDTEAATYRFELWRSPAFILGCLRRFATTLETVEIKFLANFGTTVPQMKERLQGGGLVKTVTGLPALKTLKISEGAIDRDDNEAVLVNLIKNCPSLEILEIQGIGATFPEVDMIQFVDAARESQFPSLKTVELESPMASIGWDDIPEGANVEDDEEGVVHNLTVIHSGPYKEMLASLGIKLDLNFMDWIKVIHPREWESDPDSDPSDEDEDEESDEDESE